MTFVENEVAGIIKPHKKEGAAIHVEETTQNIVNDFDVFPAVDTILESSDDWLTEYFNNSVTGQYKREVKRRQIGYAAMGFAIARTALPRMREAYDMQGSLTVPSDISDDYFDSLGIDTSAWIDLSPAERQAKRATYWLADSCRTTIESMRANNHPLYEYFTSTHQSYRTAFAPWKSGPGKDRWPHKFTTEGPILAFVQSIHINANLGVSLLCARAIHHLIHKSSEDSVEALDAAVNSSIESISWFSSEDRHIHWNPDWRLQLQTKGFLGNHPQDGARAFLQCPVAKIIEPNKYEASVTGMAIMQSPDFCSHETTRYGPVAASGACSGSVFAGYPDILDQMEARAFFEAMGLSPENGNKFSLTGVALAMGKSIMKTMILPAYSANKDSSSSAERLQ